MRLRLNFGLSCRAKTPGLCLMCATFLSLQRAGLMSMVTVVDAGVFGFGG